MAENTNYDAAFCGNLAIHQTNSIQDYGYLMVVEMETLTIIQGSENLEQICARPIREIIGLPLADLLDAEALTELKAEISKGPRTRVPISGQITKGITTIAVNILGHIKKDMVILEIETDEQETERSFSAVFQEVRSFIATLENTTDIEEICQASIHEVRRITGFDGIRMYRFDQDWNGTVIAEEITGTLESYLGQTFPASDVPRQARALYIKNPFRLIPNKDYTSYKLFPVINSVTNTFTDLSDCNLRSVAGVHLEYMANMHVSASMSIRVMVDGVLWGLISCHHITPKYLSTESRFIFEWLSMEISYRIASTLKQQQLEITSGLLNKRAQLTENIFSKGDIARGLIEDENKTLLALFNAGGFAVSVKGLISTMGTVPQQHELDNLMLWAETKAAGLVFSSSDLGAIYEEAKPYKDLASGILIIPLDRSNTDFLLCFRPERIRDIKWGGDPGQAINFEKDGKSYHPRNSFQLWLQTVHGQSSAWTAAELEQAELLRNFLFQFSAEQQYK